MLRSFALSAFVTVTVAVAPSLALADAPSVTPPAAATDASDTGPVPMGLEELSDLTGGQAVKIAAAISSQTATATNENNSITTGSYESGDVTFSPGAMVGFNGVGNVVVNTGANNNVIGNINVTIATAQ